MERNSTKHEAICGQWNQTVLSLSALLSGTGDHDTARHRAPGTLLPCMRPELPGAGGWLGSERDARSNDLRVALGPAVS